MESTSPQPLPSARENDESSAAEALQQKLDINAKVKKPQLTADLFNELVRDVLFDNGDDDDEEDLKTSWKRKFMVLYFIFQLDQCLIRNRETTYFC